MRAALLAPLLVATVLTAACGSSPATSGTASGTASAEGAGSSASAQPTATSPVATPRPGQIGDGEPAAAPAGAVFTGTVAEALPAGEYVYLRLRDGSAQEVWVATTSFDAVVGEPLTVALELPMRDFDSKTLKRSFPLLYFVSKVARNGEPLPAPSSPGAPPSLMTSHGSTAGAAAPASVVRIDRPAGGLSVADVFAKQASLANTPVTVRGQVVKFNGGIMDRNWLHLQDGSGSAEGRNNDLTVTTDGTATVGDVVTITGTVRTKQDFGAGYSYDVLIEKATIAAR